MQESSEWEALTKGVSWNIPPVFDMIVGLTREQLRFRFGAPQFVRQDDDFLGPYDCWTIRFACGLELAILWYYERYSSGEPIHNTDNEPGTVVRANIVRMEAEHILLHLGEPDGEFKMCSGDSEEFPGVPSWRVMRLDDNGNEVEMTTTISRCEATRLALLYEARGHKQTYWAQAIDHTGSLHPSSVGLRPATS